MTPWDDVEVDSDGDEMLDWLWDLPDRYDVGLEDDPTAPSAVVAASGRAGVRKRVRRPGEAESAGEAEGSAGLLDDRPTQAVDAAEPYADDDYNYGGAMFAPALGRERWIDRYTAQERVIAAAVFLVVLVVAGIGYAVINSGSGKSPKPSNLAVGPAPTTPTTLAGVIATPGAAPSVSDSTVPPDTTTIAPTTDSSVPAGVGGGGTATTTPRRCALTIAMRFPAVGSSTTTASSSTTTPTTLAPTTTAAPTTTTIWKPVTTTAPPTTAPPPTTAVAPTTTTTKAPLVSTAPPPPQPIPKTNSC